VWLYFICGMAAPFDENNPEDILNRFKQMNAECQQLAAKIQELTLEKDEHRLVIETLSKLESERKAFRLVGGILVERSVGEVLPTVTRNAEGVSFFPSHCPPYH
jgi:prefoldin subunit 2